MDAVKQKLFMAWIGCVMEFKKAQVLSRELGGELFGVPNWTYVEIPLVLTKGEDWVEEFVEKIPSLKYLGSAESSTKGQLILRNDEMADGEHIYRALYKAWDDMGLERSSRVFRFGVDLSGKALRVREFAPRDEDSWVNL